MLGNRCLLAVYGWREAAKTTDAARLRAAMLVATAFTLVVMLPLDMAAACRMVRPYRTAHTMIQAANTPIVLVDPTESMTALDLVRNALDLSNRPLTMHFGELDPARLRALRALSKRCVRAARGGTGGHTRWHRGRPVGPPLEALGCRVSRPLPGHQHVPKPVGHRRNIVNHPLASVA